eukprot:44801-Chlamydomonas_euryale.AAC.3
MDGIVVSRKRVAENARYRMPRQLVDGFYGGVATHGAVAAINAGPKRATGLAGPCPGRPPAAST